MTDVKAAVIKKVFMGTVPFRVKIDTLDISLCFNVPRCAFIGSFFYNKLENELGEVCKDFHVVINDKDKVQPNIPCGVVYDSYFPPKSGFKPLSVTIRTSLDANDKITLGCSEKRIASSFFAHSFKESIFLKARNLVFIQTKINIQQHLEESILKQDFDAYNEIKEKIDSEIEQKDWKTWPIKVYRKGQKMVNVFLRSNDDDEHEVNDFEPLLSDALKLKEITAEKVIIHGIEVSTDTKLKELMPLLSFPDGFLYVVV